MVDGAGETIRLRDGRRLGYAEFGDPGGRPLVYCHGWPGSRAEGALVDRAAKAAGVRVVAPDRPGAGLSDFQPGRAMGDWPDDVAELARVLGLERFAVLGVSGGSPYAAACACRLPASVSRTGIASGIAPLDVPGATIGMSRQNRVLFGVVARVPPLRRLVASSAAAQVARGPQRLLDRASVADVDLAAWREVRGVFMASVAEAFRSGGRGQAWELRLYARPWGFRLRDIRVPTYLWHGELDRNSPVGMGRRLAAEIPGCRATFYPGEGHLHFVARLPEILAVLCP